MWEPENSVIERCLSDTNYDFKASIEHETHQLCSVYRPISINKGFNKLLVKLFDFKQH